MKLTRLRAVLEWKIPKIKLQGLMIIKLGFLRTFMERHSNGVQIFQMVQFGWKFESKSNCFAFCTNIVPYSWYYSVLCLVFYLWNELSSILHMSALNAFNSHFWCHIDQENVGSLVKLTCLAILKEPIHANSLMNLINNEQNWSTKILSLRQMSLNEVSSKEKAKINRCLPQRDKRICRAEKCNRQLVNIDWPAIFVLFIP